MFETCPEFESSLQQSGLKTAQAFQEMSVENKQISLWKPIRLPFRILTAEFRTLFKEPCS
jgi:hypothetical protein